MKQLILFACCLFFLAACGKQEPAPAQPATPAPETAQTVQTPDASASPDAGQPPIPVCDAQYAANLRSCTPYSCWEIVRLFGEVTLRRTIEGPQADGTCLETTATNGEESYRCRFSSDQANAMAAYDEKWFNANGDFSTQVSANLLTGETTQTDTLGGEPAHNPLTDFLKDGTCVTPFQPEEPTGPVCYGGGTMTIVTIDENGNETEQEIACLPGPDPDFPVEEPEDGM